MKPLLLLTVFLTFNLTVGFSQTDSTASFVPGDTSLNMDAVYERPFLELDNMPVQLGGYMEANWEHMGTDGLSAGHQFQFRRLTLFISSNISRRLRFLTEIEFEGGTRHLSIEYAALDFEFHPLWNLRGGMILNPIGSFNQNHDGPKWEFTDRPVSSTQLLPATWSNAGFGVFGKYYQGNWMWGYEAYVSGGFDPSIVHNELERTSLPKAKENSARFEESINGEPIFTAKLAARHRKIAELGLSWMGGVYNQHLLKGFVLDVKRRCDVLAIDANTTIAPTKTFITGEWAWVLIDIPDSWSPFFGRKQYGGFVDVVQPLYTGNILGWMNASLNLACRFEYVDFHAGNFDTGQSAGDEIRSIMPGISLRPVPETVLRLNYRFMESVDVIGNPASRTGGFNFGISTYF